MIIMHTESKSASVHFAHHETVGRVSAICLRPKATFCRAAGGSCLNRFVWNGGGSWQGQPWTPDLPTDSALIFYIFAAYLEAPRCAIASTCSFAQAHTLLP